MDIRTFVSASVMGLAVFTAAPVAQDPPASQAPGYAWADSCRNCHQEIYDAWAKTKHANALDRLSSSEQEQPCVGCHLTGPKTRITEGRKVLNRGIQCEACHGAAAKHAADTTVNAGLVKVPPESLCVECHSSKSPKFKGFYYAGMASLSHNVK
jgi:predicted CXXCH cytochrome family protein